MQDIVSSAWQHAAVEWKRIEDKYYISSDGKVKSILNKRELILKTRIDRYGYEIVTLWILGKAYTKKIHRLVASAFIENPNNLATVNHKDGIKINNHAANLEWNSIKENHTHAFKTGLHTVGENRIAGKKVKLNNNSVREIKGLIKEGLSNTEIGKLYGVSCGCIYSIRVKKSWKHIDG
ncbi:MAG: hypothetical protein DRQ62_00100 [Gammaproteobacteria bacterium]|nr:MAG: hypothetical protein DRQ62_00100 [Gammaproteobacteria bacterium]